jgi:hypothetical protein
MHWQIIRPSISNCSGLGLELDPNHGNRSYHMKTTIIAIGPVSQPKTWHFNFETMAQIKYVNFLHIMTWSIRRLFSFRCSFTSHVCICDPTSIRGVVIKITLISLRICPYFSTTQRISVGSPISTEEVKERLSLHNLHIDHITIQLELKHWIGAQSVRTIQLELRSGSNSAKNPQFYVRCG